MASYFGFDAYDIERQNEPFVFISYKIEDCERVAVYARYLHDHGINVWYDNGLRAGSDWESYIMSVIERPACQGVLLFLSAKVAESTVIPLETTQARACKKPTVAIHLEPGLDIEKLLSKAIKVYVEQRQSIFAWTADEEIICRQVFTAARNAMNNIESPQHTDSSADVLWNNARVFLHNTGRSHSPEDAERAVKYLVPLTENHPADYRGWLGMAMAQCLPRVNGLEEGARRIRAAAGYYSYVVSAGADEPASPEYTGAKSELWSNIIAQVYNDSRTADAHKLRETVTQLRELDNCFGHTIPSVRHDYDRLLENLENDLEIIEKNKEIGCMWSDVSDVTVGVMKYIGSAEHYVVPSDVRGKKVVRIGAGAFRDNKSLKKTDICDGVESIDLMAFMHCSNLESVRIPQSVKVIGALAFRGCTSLNAIELPENLERIGSCAFMDCSNLETITIPDSVRKIEGRAFKRCKKLTIYGTGGYFSPAAKCARRNHVRYVRTKEK